MKGYFSKITGLSGTVEQAKSLRRETAALSEKPAKRSEAFVADFKADVGDRAIRVGKQPASAAHPFIDQELIRGLSKQGLEAAQQVIGREAGDGGDLVQT